MLALLGVGTTGSRNRPRPAALQVHQRVQEVRAFLFQFGQQDQLGDFLLRQRSPTSTTVIRVSPGNTGQWLWELAV